MWKLIFCIIDQNNKGLIAFAENQVIDLSDIAMIDRDVLDYFQKVLTGVAIMAKLP